MNSQLFINIFYRQKFMIYSTSIRQQCNFFIPPIYVFCLDLFPAVTSPFLLFCALLSSPELPQCLSEGVTKGPACDLMLTSCLCW